MGFAGCIRKLAEALADSNRFRGRRDRTCGGVCGGVYVERSFAALAIGSTRRGLVIFLLAVARVRAQQPTSGVPGSADATTSVKGTQLPAPPPKFCGVIKENLQESKSWRPSAANLNKIAASLRPSSAHAQ